MAARDPETGQFVSSHGYDDVEVISGSARYGVQAADLSGGTGFGGGDGYTMEGTVLLDYDDIVDRNERLDLIAGVHHLNVYVNSTGTADGTARLAAEISASPSLDVAQGIGVGSAQSPDAEVVGGDVVSDTIDIIGRPLVATGTQPFSDTATGVGGGGAAGDDEVELRDLPEQVREFHPRDELFLNATLDGWNIDDAGIHWDVTYQHFYGVTTD